MRKTAIVFSLLLIGVIGSSCSQPKSDKKGKSKKKAEQTEATVTSTSGLGYDLANPVKYAMQDQLLEISGIAFNNGDASVIYAEQDEDGTIFSFRPGDKNVKQAKFGNPGDYEDVAIGNNYAVILRSDGELSSFPLKEVAAGQIASIKKFKALLPAGEYEGLHFDGSKLYALCKQCAGNKHDKTCNGYVLNLAADGNFTSSGEFSIDVEKISEMAGGKKKMKFHPSALAKNPVTKQWYILSSVNNLLVVADESFKVQQAYPLNNQFLQPEGIAFDSQGNMYISNEGDKLSPGNILMFKYSAGQ